MADAEPPMPTDVRWHDVKPSSDKNYFLPNDEPSFTCFAGNDRAAVTGSWHVEGILEVAPEGDTGGDFDWTDISSLNTTLLDGQLGLHGLVRGLAISNEGKGAIETINNYPASVRVFADTTRARQDLLTVADQAAFRAPSNLMTQAQIFGPVVRSHSAAQPVGSYKELGSFSLPLHMCMNTANGNVDMARTGATMITLRLARASDAFHGRAVHKIDFTYRISNLRIRYLSVDNAGAPAEVMARTRLTSETNLRTTTSSMTTVFPASAVDGISLQFFALNDTVQKRRNRYATQRLKGFDHVIYSLNDAVNGVITKPVRDEMEALRLGTLAVGGLPHNSVMLPRLVMDDGYVLGYPLGRLMDISKVPFTVEISADSISNQSPTLMVAVAHAVIAF